MLLFCPDPQPGRAWHEASDDAWAARAVAAYHAAVERGQDGPPAETGNLPTRPPAQEPQSVCLPGWGSRRFPVLATTGLLTERDVAFTLRN